MCKTLSHVTACQTATCSFGLVPQVMTPWDMCQVSKKLWPVIVNQVTWQSFVHPVSLSSLLNLSLKLQILKSTGHSRTKPSFWTLLLFLSLFPVWQNIQDGCFLHARFLWRFRKEVILMFPVTFFSKVFLPQCQDMWFVGCLLDCLNGWRDD